MTKWKVESANINTPEYRTLLRKGWEPFAVSNQGIKIWFRKIVKPWAKGRKENED